jgi:hypothetical protein
MKKTNKIQIIFVYTTPEGDTGDDFDKSQMGRPESGKKFLKCEENKDAKWN